MSDRSLCVERFGRGNPRVAHASTDGQVKALIWFLYCAWVATAVVYAQSVASASPYVADLVRLPWDQVAAAASLAFAGGGVAFLTRLNMGQVNPDRLMREFTSDVVTGAFSGAVAFAVAASEEMSLWRTFILVAIAGTMGGVFIEAIRSFAVPMAKRFLARFLGP